MIIVWYVVSKHAPSDGPFISILWTILQLLTEFEDVKFFHALRVLNSEVDRQENVVCNLGQGNLLISGEDMEHCFIP